MSKKTIAVDIDEVLAAFAESFANFCNEKWGTNLKPEDWTEHWAEIWKVDFQETEKRADIIYKSDVFIRVMHNPEAKEVLNELSKKFKLVVVTSRHRAVSNDTIKWIKTYFSDLFQEIHFAGIYDDIEKHPLERLKVTKAEICKQIGANYLIDDSPKHCMAVAEAGITALLFGEYKWTKVDNLPGSIIKVKNWQEVLEYFTRTNFQSLDMCKKNGVKC